MAVQWVHLGAQTLLVASERGAWLQPTVLGLPAIDGPMPGSLPASVGETRHLLDGAIATAEREAPAGQPPPMTPERWAWNLAGQWYCAHHSIPLLAEVAERFAEAGRTELAEFAARKHEQEKGHDDLPIADLRALGYDAETFLTTTPIPRSSIAFVDYARGCVNGPDPVEFLGYIYAIERHVVRLTPAWFATLDAALPRGIEAASALRTHATGLDLEHVAEAVTFFACLPAGERTSIALGCYRTTQTRLATRKDILR